ncbi:hypothetical protein FRC03_001174 [Tulasnella sp. 419]|nr:hypothetical protein FRC03_001174 [Tulasnella sp. 419]
MLSSDHKKAIFNVLQSLFSYKTSRDRVVAEPFLDLPDKVAWKDYYKVIPEPRCLNGIKSKLEKGGYKHPMEVHDDLSLVFNNALHYNEDGSTIAKDARTLKALFERNWVSESSLPQPESLVKVQKPDNRPSTQMLPTVSTSIQPIPQADDMDVSPTGEKHETNWESMKPRDKQGDELIKKTDRLLPKWKGPGPDGWMALSEKEARDPYERYKDILERLKNHVGKDDQVPAIETLNRIQENASLPDISFTTPMSMALIQSRVELRAYPTSKDFDMDLNKLFEKGRRWFEEGSKEYGRVLVLQRLYQALTSHSAAVAALPNTASFNFSSIPAGPGTAKPIHSAASTSEDGVTTYRIQNKERAFIDEIVFKGMTYRMGDYVHLMNPNDPSRPIIGQIFKCYVPDNAASYQKSITACWYFRPEQTFHSSQRPFWEREVFKTSHFADHAIEDVIEKIAVQFMTKHIRGRPKPPAWYPGWPLYVCDSRYNDRDKVFVRIKNWNSCIPDELRKNDFMPILPFEGRTVMPKKVESPFLRGVKGPGGLVDEDEGRRKSSRRAVIAAKAVTPQAPATSTSASLQNANNLGPYAGIAQPSKSSVDRTLVTAAGGMSALGGNPIIEELPAETVQLFDRDPDTDQLLWFTGPPVDVPDPKSSIPRYNLDYLYYLAKKKKALEKIRDQEEDDDEVDGMDQDHDADPKRRRLEEYLDEELGRHRPIPKKALRDSLKDVVIT